MDPEVRRSVVKDCIAIRTWATQVVLPDVTMIDVATIEKTALFAPPAIVEAYDRLRSTLTEAGISAPTVDGPPVKILLPPDAIETLSYLDIILKHVS